MKAKTDALQNAFYELSSKVYQAAGGQGNPADAAAAAGAAGVADNGDGKDGGDFVDADFTDVK